MSERASTSASNVHRRIDCPGSEVAEAGLAEQESEYSREGIALHAIFSLPEAEFVAIEGDDKHERDAKSVALVAYARNLARKAFAAIVQQFAIPADELYEQGTETELWVHIGFTKTIPGHCDVWRYYPRLKLLVILDAKFGYIEVDAAPINWQLRTYAIGGSEQWDVENCAVGIIQPRADEESGAEKITLAHYTREAIAQAKAQLLAHREAWLAPAAPLVPSPSACRYCKAKEVCRPYLSRLSPAANLHPDILASVAAMSPEELVRFWIAIKLASNEKVQDAIKGEMRKRVGAGLIPGYKLKENAARTTVTDQPQALALAYNLVGWDGIQACAKISTGELAKTLARKSKGTASKMTEAEAKKVVASALADVTKKEAPAPSVVPDDQPPTLIAIEE